jgi:hypothetical protein
MPDKKKSASEIKGEIDLLAYMLRDGVRIDPTQKRGHKGITWCICPVHSGGNERTGSLAVYEDQHWFCYGGCHRGGDLFSYVMWRNGLADSEFSKAVKLVTGEADKIPFAPPAPFVQEERKVYVPSIEEVVRLREGYPLVERYVSSRAIPGNLSQMRMIGGRRIHKGFTDSVGQRFPIEYNQVSIPYMFGGDPYSINFRRDDLSCMAWISILSARYGMDFLEYIKIDLAEKKNLSVADISDEKAMSYAFGPRFYRPADTRVSAYGVDWFVRREGDRIHYNRLANAIITEGEVDELSGSALRFPVLANKIPQSGKTTNVNIQRILQGVTQIYVAVDNNDAGEKYAEGAFKALGSDRSRVRFFRFPESHGDMNKMLQANMLEEFLTGSPLHLEPMPYMV